jgi:hypothetical protein
MSPQQTDPLAPEDFRDEPLYWFLLLDRAVEEGDHAAAAAAQRELEQLGVRVRYGRPRQKEAHLASE